jgi:hypothetical protein
MHRRLRTAFTAAKPWDDARAAASSLAQCFASGAGADISFTKHLTKAGFVRVVLTRTILI